MTEHPIDRGLRSLGVDPADLDADVLKALRNAKDDNVKVQGAQALADAFADAATPTTDLLKEIDRG